MNIKKSALFRIVTLMLVIFFVFPVSATAVEPRASDYLSSYSAYLYPAGWGKIQVWVSVSGVGYVDEIGALNIWLYESTDQENWTLVKTFHYLDYPDLFGYDDYYHSGHVEYAGTIGRYYKAYVCVWAGTNGTGDSRYFWIGPEKATLFAAPTV